MSRIKYIFAILIGLIVMIIGLYQTDFIKRKIASANHRISLPKYVDNISIVKPKTIFVLSTFNSSITQFKVPEYQIKNFFNDINGKQIFIDNKPVGDLSDIESLSLKNFSIVYRDNVGQLNGITLNYDNKNSYSVEIKSSRE